MLAAWDIFNSVVTQPWIFALVCFIIFFVGFSTAFRWLWKLFIRWAKSARPNWAHGHLLALRRPLHFLLFFIAAYISIRFCIETGSTTLNWLNGALKTSLIFCGVWLVERISILAIVANASHITSSNATRDLLLLVTRIAIISVGILVGLDNLGISITPILASLGVGSVAVALALQDTLSNFLSGVYLLVDQPIRVGDFIKLESDVEGYVKKIGWRSTQIQLLSNNVVITPNTKIATARLTNFDLFDQESSVVIPASVSYDGDLDHIEQVTLAVATEIQQRVEGAVRNFQPLIRYTKLADSGIEFNVILRSKQFTDSYLIRHEFIRALILSYRKENIEIPFPQRVVHTPKQ
ncbi:MAG: mechanosensitive ion channel family protein [Bdellovibrionales bacterium]|nr:mechanosensitive ion channel family protein [Bdellovibrionales bacterium]